ncbi:uncharacterized protein LOC124199601 [Daphnia pulex]|uniref:uncharacterized protein LOC124199601 n=1 Tax=Daphnia pulex TaxID=6669 RepID=UPI001EDF1599|nr:uncharacterized protein LOC124199601 [Daphnia pulex]
MRLGRTCLLILGFSLANVVISAIATEANQIRFFFGSTSLSFATFTIIKATTTTTSTFTSVTTCTTSTATLTTCTIGRRRRGLFYDDATANGRSRRALFYNDDETETGSDFLSSEKKIKNPPMEKPNTSIEELSLIPLEIEPGFSAPEGGPNRFLLAAGTSTITSIVITTSTSSLTAICSSTTGFPLCGNTGKKINIVEKLTHIFLKQ